MSTSRGGFLPPSGALVLRFPGEHDPEQRPVQLVGGGTTRSARSVNTTRSDPTVETHMPPPSNQAEDRVCRRGGPMMGPCEW